MTFEVVSLRRADADVRGIVRWIAQRSPAGASKWLDAYEQMLGRHSGNVETFAAATEDSEFDIPLRQALFSTLHGRTYRAIFTVVGQQIRILRIRGPGQPPLQQDELL
jgi:plasmid stabilization system protein ParE